MSLIGFTLINTTIVQYREFIVLKFSKNNGLFFTLALLAIPVTGHAWTKTLNFENADVGEVAEKKEGTFDGAAGASTYTDEKVFDGELAARLFIEKDQRGFGTWGGIIQFPSILERGDEFWFSVYTFFPHDFNYDSYGEGNHLKFLRLHISNQSGDNVGYNDWYIAPEASQDAHKFIFEGAPAWHKVISDVDKIVRGTWESYEMYIKLDTIPASLGGEARIRMWKNGLLLLDIDDQKTLQNPTDYADRAHLFTYWNGGSPQTQHMFVDKIIVTNEEPNNFDVYGYPITATGSDFPASPNPPVLNIE